MECPKIFARNAKKIVVDIDKYELNKKRGLNIDIKINKDVNFFLKCFNNINKEKFLWLRLSLKTNSDRINNADNVSQITEQ